MVISGGVNIYPREAEQVLATHPQVVDVAVFGVPDEEMGESLLAVVQRQLGDESLTGTQLMAWCRDRLAGYKCSRTVEFITEMLPQSRAENSSSDCSVSPTGAIDPLASCDPARSNITPLTPGSDHVVGPAGRQTS